jgi:hypothetical protein
MRLTNTFISNGYWYNEGDLYMCYGPFGVSKMETNIHLVWTNGVLGLYNEGKIKRQLWRTVLLYEMSKFRVVGRGYKLYLDRNNMAFRLGYSHNIYFLMPLECYMQKKEKSVAFWKIYGVSRQQQNYLLHQWKYMKYPNCYTSKGIFRENEWFVQKEGKKAYSL